MRIGDQAEGWQEPNEITPTDFVLPSRNKIPEPLRWITPQMLTDLYRLIVERGVRSSRGSMFKIIILEDLEGVEPGKTLEFVIGTEKWPDQRSMLVTGFVDGKRALDHQLFDLQNEQHDLICWDPTVTEADIRKILEKS